MFSLALSPQTVVVAKKNQITPTAQFITFKKKIKKASRQVERVLNGRD